MNSFLTMVKINMKLLLRNKGYLLFLIILPVFSILLLNIRTNAFFDVDDKGDYFIHEIENGKRFPFNIANTKLAVGVFDSSDSYLSDFILQQLANSGSYQIYRYKTEIESPEIAEKEAIDFGNRNTVGAVLYIPPELSFYTEGNLSGDEIILFGISEDERISLLKENLSAALGSLVSYSELAGANPSELKNLIETAAENQLQKQSVTLDISQSDDRITLTALQQDQRSNIGYSLAVVSIAFLFSGIFIAAIIIEEKQNLVYTRILLTNTSLVKYNLVKLVLAFITTILQVVFIGIGIKLFVKTDLGISFTNYLFFVFGIGLIFNLLSVIAGSIIDNLLSATYLAFSVWTISCMAAGIYFPLDNASVWWQRVSLLMPQRWVIKCSEILMTGGSGAHFTFVLIVSAFIAIILSIGLIGTKMKRA